MPRHTQLDRHAGYTLARSQYSLTRSFCRVNISLPGTSSFIGEILASIGLFETNRFVVVSATTRAVLGAACALQRTYSAACAAEDKRSLLVYQAQIQNCVSPMYRQISQHVAMDVIKIAAEEGHLSSVKAMRALANSDESLLHWIDAHMYKPKYNSLIRLPTGVLE